MVVGKALADKSLYIEPVVAVPRGPAAEFNVVLRQLARVRYNVPRSTDED